MKLNLDRPIVFFDLETTGVDIAKDRIVELCYIKVLPDGEEKAKSMRIKPVDAEGNQIHIPETASAVHGIYDEDVKDCPAFRDIARDFYGIIEGCDLAGFNSNHFDVPLLVEEFLRAGISIDIRKHRLVDVFNIYRKLEPRTLSAAYKFYCHADLEDAHSALADTTATLRVLQAQLDRYPDVLENNIDFLVDYSDNNKEQKTVDLAGRIVCNEQGVKVFNFGKHKGRAVTEVLMREPGYFAWMMNGDFPENTKQELRKIKQEWDYQRKKC